MSEGICYSMLEGVTLSHLTDELIDVHVLAKVWVKVHTVACYKRVIRGVSRVITLSHLGD